MKNLSAIIIKVIFSVFLTMLLSTCGKHENPIIYEEGTFPDTVVNLKDMNSVYDDYNVTFYEISGNIPLVFSSNRGSGGGQFDLVQGIISFIFDRTSGQFGLGADINDNEFIDNLIAKVNTTGNDFGPYRLYSPYDGKEYLILSSVNGNGDLDLRYTKNSPVFGYPLPDIDGPYPLTLLNSASDEAYVCFNTNEDSLYFCSNKEGNFDIMLHKRPANIGIHEWFSNSYEASEKVEVLNSAGDDKCPNIYKRIMLFASNRPGGFGGFDLYYSVFKNGNWSTPVNMGPAINTASDEYRPVVAGHENFTNLFMVFSSNRPGGEGNFDLYYAGIPIPQ